MSSKAGQAGKKQHYIKHQRITWEVKSSADLDFGIRRYDPDELNPTGATQEHNNEIRQKSFNWKTDIEQWGYLSEFVSAESW